MTEAASAGVTRIRAPTGNRRLADGNLAAARAASDVGDRRQRQPEPRELARRSQRDWRDPDDHPDGISMDAETGVWYADVGNHHCVRVREGREVLGTVELDRGAFACALSRGYESRLFVAQTWGGPSRRNPAGESLRFPAPLRAPRDLDRAWPRGCWPARPARSSATRSHRLVEEAEPTPCVLRDVSGKR